MKDNRGSISIFVSLILLVIISSLFLLIDGTRIVYGNTKVKQSIVGANEHILANYHRELNERYHLFLLDPAFVAETGISKEIQSYLEKSICNSKKKGNLYPFQIQEISIVREVYPDEEKLAPIKHQIREYMKYKQISDWTNELVGKMTILSDKDRQEEEMSELLEQQQEDMDSYEEESGGQGEMETGGDELEGGMQEETDMPSFVEQVEDPREIVMETVNGGILRVVLPEGKSISKRKVAADSLPSHELENVQGEENSEKVIDFLGLDMIKNMFTKANIDDAMGSISTEAMTVAYVMDCFSNFLEKANKDYATKLSYEVEYIIGGGKTDKENLEHVVNKILLFRFGTNFAYALSDAQLNAQAFSIATALAGIIGIPPLITAIKTMVLAAASYAEAILDTRSLLDGNKISILKNPSNWMVSVERVGELLSSGVKTSSDENGIGYDDFLKIFLLTQKNKDTKYARMLDLMQENIKIKDKSFSIMEAMFGYEVYCKIKLPMFFSVGSKTFELNRSCSY